MSIHAKFFQFVGTLNNGNALQNAYRSYKAASFELNGKLKAGATLDTDSSSMIANLNELICARSKSDLLLYRMTSRHEFIGSVLDILEKSQFSYQAYMSTSGDAGKIHSFTPRLDPLVLEISVPAGMTFALLEASQGAGEDEYLLGCGTKFQLGIPKAISNPIQASEFTGLKPYQGILTLLPIKVTADPPYVSRIKEFFNY